MTSSMLFRTLSVLVFIVAAIPSSASAALECSNYALGCVTVTPVTFSCVPTLYSRGFDSNNNPEPVPASNPMDIDTGEEVYLNWSGGFFAQGTDVMSISNYGVVTPATYGAVTVSPTEDTTYIARCEWTRTSYLGTTGGTYYSLPREINVNQPPGKPTITGPTTGSVDTTYQFSFRSTDADGDTVRFRIDWDNDGSTADSPGGQVTGFVASGAASTQSQSWSTPGTYTFKAYAKDTNGLNSSPLWSNTFTITISDPTPACANGIDDDGDGLIDTADYGCSGDSDDSESPNPQCSDGSDNDGDGDTDYPDDLGCLSLSDTTESPNPQCSDEIDNDGNGLTDLADPGCEDSSDNNETAPEVESEVTFSITPELVRSGDSVSVTWSVTDVSSCTIAGSNGDSWTGTSGSETSSAITAETTFVIACEETDGDLVSASQTIKLVPAFQEVFRTVPTQLANLLHAFTIPWW